MRRIATAASLATAALMARAPSSHACEPTIPVLDTVFPFEGHTLPRNATLGAINVDDTVYAELVSDDGVVRRVAWSDNDARFTPELPDGLLPVGRQVLTLLSTDDDNVSRDIIFGVDDRVDSDAATVSVSISRRIGGDAFGQENLCGASTPWPTSFATIAIESGDDVAFVELASGERLRLFDGSVEVTETDRNLSGLVVVDFAGNASVPEIVEASDGGGGCGCRSSNASTTAALGLVAVLLRRRCQRAH
jgi:hypothetical protein